MSDNNAVTETANTVVETVGANKKALVAAGVTIVVAVAVGAVLKYRSRLTDTEEAVEETAVTTQTKSTKKSNES